MWVTSCESDPRNTVADREGAMAQGKLVGVGLAMTVVVALAVGVFLGTGAAAPAPDTTGEWTLADVLAMSRDQIIDLWSASPAPDFTAFKGHYMGLVPNAGDPERRASTDATMFHEDSERGYWLGKAYMPTTTTTGEGYNRWRFPGGKIVRNLRFGTEDGTSLIDGNPALLMYYGAFNEGNTLIDEIRQLSHDIFLGMGTREAEDGGRSEPGHFVLIGPTDDWVGVD